MLHQDRGNPPRDPEGNPIDIIVPSGGVFSHSEELSVDLSDEWREWVKIAAYAHLTVSGNGEDKWSVSSHPDLRTRPGK